MVGTYYGIGYYFSKINKVAEVKDVVDDDVFDMHKMEYTLEELAHKLWLKNELQYTSHTTEMQLEIARKECPAFVHQITTNFWNTHISKIYWLLEHEEDRGFYELINSIKKILIFLDDEKNAKMSSVSSKIKNEEINKKETTFDNESRQFKADNTYEVFKTVDLLTHTLGVTEQMIPVLCKKINKMNCIGKLGDGILAALGHDLGKIERQNNSEENRSHELVSIDVFKKLVGDVVPESNKKTILEAISMHHISMVDDSSGQIGYALVQADQQQRAKELRAYHKNNDNKYNIGSTIIEIVEDKIRKEILRYITSPSTDEKSYIYYDKTRGGLIYLDLLIFENFKVNHEINDSDFLDALKRLRKIGIIMLVDFSKYNALNTKLKYDNGDIVSADLIPVDFTKLALTQAEMHLTFMNDPMPKVLTK